MPETNRQWLLAKRPIGMVTESDFELVERPNEVPQEGQVLLRTRMLAFEPAMRGWISDKDNYIRPVGIGEVMRSMAVSEVVESKLEGFDPGDLVTGMTGWQEWSIADQGLRKLAADDDPVRSRSPDSGWSPVFIRLGSGSTSRNSLPSIAATS